MQGEGGEQWDVLLLFSLGQHPAWTLVVQAQLVPGEFLFTYLDDIYVVSSPERARTVYTVLQHASGGSQGFASEICDALERMAHIEDPTVCVWGGSRQGMKVLGTPLGHRDFVRTHLEWTSVDHQFLLDRIPMLEDLESSWLLLVHCAAARANHMMRVVEPEAAQEFCQRHDAALWRCFCTFTNRGVTTTRCQRHCVNASRVGRPWVEECGSHKELGQLGRLSFDGPATSSTGGCSTGATYFGHDLLWPRPILARPTLATVNFDHFRE